MSGSSDPAAASSKIGLVVQDPLCRNCAEVGLVDSAGTASVGTRIQLHVVAGFSLQLMIGLPSVPIATDGRFPDRGAQRWLAALAAFTR